MDTTTEFANKTIEVLETRIRQLEWMKDNLNKTANDNYTNQQALRTYLIDNYEDLELHADSIANIFGIELTKEVEAEVTVTYYITVNVPVGQDAEDTINDIDFDSISYNSDYIINLASSVDSIDI